MVRAGTKYVSARGKSRGEFSQSKKKNGGEKYLQVEKKKVECAMQESFLTDSFYLDRGVLLTYIYFLITQNYVINLSVDSACHTNEWIRILSVDNQPSRGKGILVPMTHLTCFFCISLSSSPLYLFYWGISPKETSFFF